MAPLDKELRAYARRQPGCKALMAHYGIGELTAVTILAELGDARRFANSRDAVRYAGWTSPCTSQTSIARPASSPAEDHPRCVGRYTKPRKSRVAQAAPTAPTTCRPPSDSAATAPAWPSRGSSSSAADHTPCASSAIKRSCPPDPRCASSPHSRRNAPRPAPEDPLPPPSRGRPRKIERPRRFPQRDPPIKHHVAGPEPTRVADRSKPGARAHNKHPRQRAHAPPNSTTPVTPLNRGLTARRRTSKQVSTSGSLASRLSPAPRPAARSAGQSPQPMSPKACYLRMRVRAARCRGSDPEYRKSREQVSAHRGAETR